MKRGLFSVLTTVFLVLISTGFAQESKATYYPSTENQDKIPQDVQDMTKEFMTNNVNNEIKVTDGSFSMLTMSTNHVGYGGFSAEEMSEKLPAAKEYLFKNLDTTNSAFKDGDIEFSLNRVDPYKLRDSGEYVAIDNMNGTDIWSSSLKNGLILTANYRDKEIGHDLIKIDMGDSPIINAEGTINNDGDRTQTLVDDDGNPSNRGVASKSAWYTDKYKIDMNTGQARYRVSTHEWLTTGFVQFKGDSGLRIHSYPINQLFFYSTDYNQSTETLFKTNGGTWDYGLYANNWWQPTQFGYDQYGLPYYEVSTDAWARACFGKGGN